MKAGAAIGLLLLGTGAVFVTHEVNLFKEKSEEFINSFKFDDIQSGHTNYKYLYFILDLDIFNPMSIPVPFAQIKASVTVNSHLIGVAATPHFMIPADRKTNFKMTFILPSINILSSVIELLAQRESVTTDLKGSISTLFGTKLINETFQLAL